MASSKIRAKDLSYDANLPPFLQRLRGQHTGTGGDPDRHERALARPKRAHEPDEEDGPTVVLEGGDTISQQEFEKQAAAHSKKQDDYGAADSTATTKRKEQNATDGMTSKKRKSVKIVAADEQGESVVEAHEQSGLAPAKKLKKKGKPIKLAFEDDGD